MATARMYMTSPQIEEQAMRVSDIQWNAERRSVRIGHTVINLTSTEFKLLFALRHGMPVTYAELALQVYDYAFVDVKMRLTMDKHIDRARGKLRGTGIYVYCVLGYGYLLLPEGILDETERLSSKKKGL
jgi:DNA-binding response OmpR family regulator